MENGVVINRERVAHSRTNGSIPNHVDRSVLSGPVTSPVKESKTANKGLIKSSSKNAQPAPEHQDGVPPTGTVRREADGGLIQSSSKKAPPAPEHQDDVQPTGTVRREADGGLIQSSSKKAPPAPEHQDDVQPTGTVRREADGASFSSSKASVSSLTASHDSKERSTSSSASPKAAPLVRRLSRDSVAEAEEVRRNDDNDRSPNDNSVVRNDRSPNDNNVVRNDRSPNVNNVVRNHRSPNDNSVVRNDRSPNDNSVVRNDRSPNDNSVVRNDRSPNDNSVVRNDRSPNDNSVVRNDRSPNDNSVVRNDRSPNDNSVERNDRSPDDNSVVRNDRSPNDNSVVRNDMSPTDNSVVRNDRSPNDNSVVRNDRSPNDNSVVKNDRSPNVNSVVRNDRSPNDNSVVRNDMSPNDNSVERNDRSPNDNSVVRNDRSPNDNSVVRNDRSPNDNSVVRNDRSPNDNGVVRNDRSPNDNSVVRNDRSPNDNSVVRNDRSPNDNSVVRNDRSPNDNSVVRNDRSPNDNSVVGNDRSPNDNSVTRADVADGSTDGSEGQKRQGRVRFSGKLQYRENSGDNLSYARRHSSEMDAEHSASASHQQDIKQAEGKSRIDKLMERRRRVTQNTETLQDPDEQKPHPKPDVGAMLDLRIKALDFMVTRNYPEEMLMAKQQLQPRRFQRSKKMQSKWKVAQDILVLQEMLVRLTTARQEREQRQAEMKATDDTKTQHPGSTSLGKRVTPEGQSADELSAETNSRSPKKQAGKQQPNSKQKKQTQPGHFKPSSKPPNVISTQAEVHVNGGSLDKAEPNISLFATTKEMQTTEQSLLSVPTDNARSESRSQTPMEIKNELNALRHQEASNTDILKSHSESCLTHTGCSRAEKQNMWKKAFLLISKRRRLTRRMAYIKAFAPEILNHIKREGKSPSPPVPTFSSGDKMPRSNKPTNGSVSKTNIPQPRPDRPDMALRGRLGVKQTNKQTNKPRPVSVPGRITERPSSCSIVSSRAKRKDKFDELCDKNCRHIGVVPTEEREDSFLPQIVPKTSSTNSRGSSSERSSSCKLPEISNVSSASPTEETKHREEVFKHRKNPRLNLKLEPLRTKNDAKKPRRPQSENPTKVSRDSNSRRRLASVQDDYSNLNVSDNMMERIIDITRIYSSTWIQKMRERMRERTNTLEEVSERTS